MGQPLTWKNVAAPDFSPVTGMLKMAADGFSGGMNGVSDALNSAREAQKTNRSADGMGILAGVRDSAGVAPALQQLGQTVNARDMTPELQQAMLNLQGVGLGYDNSRSVTNERDAGNTRDQQTHDFTRQLNKDKAGVTQQILDQFGRTGGTPGSTNQGTGMDAFSGMSELDMIAMTIDREAANQGEDGQRAVANTLVNRLGTGRWGNNYHDVITAPGQYSWTNGYTGYNGGGGGRSMDGVKPSKQAYAIAAQAMSGMMEDNTNGALNYYVNGGEGAVNPKWGAGAGGEWTQIGDHLFGVADGGARYTGPRGQSAGRAPGTAQQGNAAAGGGAAVGDANAGVFSNGFNLSIPDGSSLRFEDVQSALQQFTSTQAGYDDDRERDDAYNQTLLGRQQAEQAKQDDLRYREVGLSYLDSHLWTGVGDTEKVMDDLRERGFSDEDIAGTMGYLTTYTEQNGSDFNPNLSKNAADVNFVDQETIKDAGTQASWDDQTDPILRQAIRLMSSPGIESDPESILSSVSRLAQTEGVKIQGTDNDFVTMINKIAREYGISPGVALKAVENGISGTLAGGGKISMNEGLIRKELSLLGDKEDFIKASNIVRSREIAMAEAEKLVSRRSALRTQIAVLEKKPKSAAQQKRLQEVTAELEATEGAMTRFRENHVKQPNPEAGTAEAERDAEEAVELAAAGPPPKTLSEVAAEQAAAANTPDNPRTGWQEGQDAGRLKEAFMNELHKAGMELNAGGAGIGSETIGSMRDFFYETTERAEANTQSRTDHRDTAAWMYSPKTKEFFMRNPEEFAKFKEDKVGYYKAWIAKQEEGRALEALRRSGEATGQ